MVCLCIAYQWEPGSLETIKKTRLNGGIHKDRAHVKQSLLRWPCPLTSDRVIPALWWNLELGDVAVKKCIYSHQHTISITLSITTAGFPQDG